MQEIRTKRAGNREIGRRNNKYIVDLNNWTKIYEYIGELNETK